MGDRECSLSCKVIEFGELPEKDTAHQSEDSIDHRDIDILFYDVLLCFKGIILLYHKEELLHDINNET